MAKLPKKKENDKNDEIEVVKPTTADKAEDESKTLEDVMSVAASAANSVQNDTESDVDSENEVPDEEKNNEETTVKNDTKETKHDDGITVSKPEKTVAPKSPMVEVATTVDHTCSIGGKRYEFKRGVKTSVPRPIKDILRNAGLLMPL